MVNVKQIPWRSMILNSVAIILSILLAFAIDASWDAFRERNQEKAFLVSLLSDFRETQSRINESIDSHTKFAGMGRQLLVFLGGDASSVEPEVLEPMLSAVFFDWHSQYIASGSRDALFASGDIEIIGNEELRAMLAVWPSEVADAAEDDALIANDVMTNLMPYLQSKVRTRNIARITSSETAEFFPRVDSVNYDALWSDPLFENLITSRILNETYAVGENKRLSEAADEIIRVIEKELGR